MLKEFEFYHGVILSRLVHGSDPVRINTYPTDSNASYVLNSAVGLYIKHSTKRMTPWRFSFQKKHQNEILEMKEKFNEVFLILVCGDDGIVTLGYKELKKILDEQHEEVEWIAVSRRPREKYTVKGSNGKLKYKIGENEFPNKILKKLPKLDDKKKIFKWL